MAVLEQQRQQMIVMSAASHTMRIIGAPKVAAQPSQAAGGAAVRQAPAVRRCPAGPGDRAADRLQHAVLLRLEPEHLLQLPE